MTQGPQRRSATPGALVALGRMVVFDRALSADGQVSCATCHRPDHVFSDGLARAVGAGGQQGTRNTPSLLDVWPRRARSPAILTPAERDPVVAFLLALTSDGT